MDTRFNEGRYGRLPAFIAARRCFRSFFLRWHCWLKNEATGAGESIKALDQQNLFVVVYLAKFYLDDLAIRSLNRAPYEAGLDGKLAMTAVDQRQKLHAARTSVIEERIEGGAGGAACVQHVVNQYDLAIADIKTERAWDHDRPRATRRQIIAIKADVQNSNVNGVLFDL